ncbi:MAG: hypothetical protein ING75_02125 [Rhodocyclaceae bacterium]|nr:hypothetical protein [Rhodocyclaceae bacterium]
MSGTAAAVVPPVAKPYAANTVYRSTLERMNVAVLRRTEVFQSPLIQSHYRKGFYIISRNAWFVSILGRVLVGEALAAKAEDLMFKQVNGVTASIAKVEARIAKLSESLGVTETTQFSLPKEANVDIVHPVAYRHLESMKVIDRVLAQANALFNLGEMSATEKAKLELELKNKLLALMTSTKGAYNTVLNASKKKNAAVAEQVDRAAQAMAADGTLPVDHQDALQNIITNAEDAMTGTVIEAIDRPLAAQPQTTAPTEPSVTEIVAEARKAEEKASKKAKKAAQKTAAQTEDTPAE